MKNTENTLGSRILAFHIGRGGRFYNAGHLSFIGENSIDEFTNDLFLRYENESEILKNLENRTNLIAKFDECRESDDFSFFEKIGFDLGEKSYVTCGGEEVGLTEDESSSGVGTINIDGGYDTTYCIKISDLTEEEITLLIKTNNQYYLNLYAEFLGFSELEIKLMDKFNDYEYTLINGVNPGDYLSKNFTSHIEGDLNEKYLEFEGVFYTQD